MNKKQKILAGIFIAAGAVAIVFFGMRALHSLNRMRGNKNFGMQPAQQTDVELMREWMTVPYIARTYAMPPEALFAALDIPEHENRKKSLKEINNEFYPQTPGEALARVKTAVLNLQQASPPAPPQAPTAP